MIDFRERNTFRPETSCIRCSIIEIKEIYWSSEVQKVKQKSLNVPIISKTLSCLRWQRKLIFCLKPKLNIKSQHGRGKTFLSHISKMNPFLVTHSSNKIYLRTFFVVTTFNSFPKPLEAIYLYTICKKCVREPNRFVALSLIVG